MKLQNPDLIEYFFNHIYIPGYAYEVKIPHANINKQSNRIVRVAYQTTVAGWFDRVDELLCELSRIQDASACLRSQQLICTQKG
jgi:hypothetical protein